MEQDVAIAGGGPAGLTCAYYLAGQGIRVALFERKTSIGGGMWGGGMMFNDIVVQAAAKRILDEFEINSREYKQGYYIADAIETVSTLCSKAVKAGARVFNLISVEDVKISPQQGAGDKLRVDGLVINWSAVGAAGLHVDPLTVSARFVVDATGHASEVARIIERKVGQSLRTTTGRVLGEKSMWAERGEELIVENTKEIYPGVYVAGMAANAVFGGPRMGPIFGGMLLSGEKVAKELIARLTNVEAEVGSGA